MELQGHGHTSEIERPLRFELLADDIAALITQLGFDQADILGYSLGGGVALQTAIRHPEVARKLALVSTPFSTAGWYPEDRAAQAAITADAFAGTPLHDTYLKTSPTPDVWTTVVDKVRDLVTADYDWSEAVAALRAPVLLVVADGDGIQLRTWWSFLACSAVGRRMVIWLACPPQRSRYCLRPHMSAGRRRFMGF